MKIEALERYKDKLGAIYNSIDYVENWVSRVFPIWFVVKRYAFVAMVFNSENTLLMVLVSIHISLLEMLAVVYWAPYLETFYTKMEVFNLIFAYLVQMVL